MKSINNILLITTVLIASCTADKMFLKPDKYPHELRKITIRAPDDTLHVYFTGDNHQPLFTKSNDRDTVLLSYTIESVIFKGDNKDTLNGWFMKPRDHKPDITIICFHGNSGSLFSQYKAISPLIKNGFQIFLLDYGGFGFSTGEATRKGSLLDALSAIEYVRKRKDVAGTKLVVYGQSFGGHIAAVAAEKKQNEIDGLVLEGTFSSPREIASRKVPILGWLVTQPNSAKKSVKTFHKPILVIHSTEDAEVPYYMGQKLFKAANSPKSFYEIRQCHICGPTYYSNEISSKIIEMLR
jgi:fermentation-respiration switch protein FrsA (DUF1100 family)